MWLIVVGTRLLAIRFAAPAIRVSIPLLATRVCVLICDSSLLTGSARVAIPLLAALSFVDIVSAIHVTHYMLLGSAMVTIGSHVSLRFPHLDSSLGSSCPVLTTGNSACIPWKTGLPVLFAKEASRVSIPLSSLSVLYEFRFLS